MLLRVRLCIGRLQKRYLVLFNTEQKVVSEVKKKRRDKKQTTVCRVKQLLQHKVESDLKLLLNYTY